MDIMISENLRELRKKRGNTQEELADFLTVSPQAVSKWERGDGLPDISILPRIAAYYDVSLDELFGVSEIRKREKIEGYQKKSMKLRNKGLMDENLKLWREAQKEFPNEIKVIYKLMYALSYFSEDDAKISDEVISLGERILRESTDNAYREGAVQVLCFTYDQRGDKEKAKEYAKMGGDMWTSCQELLAYVMTGDERKRQNMFLLLDHLDLMGSALTRLCQNQDYERYLYLHEFYLKILALYFDDGFYGFYSCRAVQRHHWLARIYLGVRNDEEKTREHLEAAEKFAEQYDNLDGKKYTYTSTLLNGLEYDMAGTSKNSTQNETERLLDYIHDSHFDRLHDRDWFIALEQRLREKAAKK